MPDRLGHLLGLDRAALHHGLRLAFAAWLAFAIASFLHVGNAYWAAMPIWVVSQSARGLLLERGFFRCAGTLLGAAAGFGILRFDAHAYLMFALLGVWVGGNAVLVHLLRGVHGYGAMMAGMTAAVVVLPSVLQPEHAAALAAARVECTLIGVVVVTLVTGFWTPAAPRRAFYAQVRRLAADAAGFTAALLAGTFPEPADAAVREQQILREMGEVQGSASLIAAGSLEGYRRLHHVHALIVASLAVMAAGRALAQRRQHDPASAEPLVGTGAPADAALAGRAPGGTASPNGIGGADSRLAAALHRLTLAEQAFDAEPGAADARSFHAKATYLAPHRDARLAVESGVIAGGATLVAATLAYLSAWPAGDLAALGVCIFSLVLGSMPNPRTIVPIMLRGICAGVAAALLYRLVVQPHVATVAQLIASVAPFILLGGLARVSRRTAGPALDFNMCFMLASQAVLPPVTDRIAIMNGSAALLLAAGLVATGFMLLPPHADRRATRAARAIGADLLRMVRQGGAPDPDRQQARATRQILRLSLHLEQATAGRADSGYSLLAALNLGEAIVRLQSVVAAPESDAATRQAGQDALRALHELLQDPDGVAAALAGQAAPATVAPLLRDTAAALRASRGLLACGKANRGEADGGKG